MMNQHVVNFATQNIGTILIILVLLGVLIWRIARWTGWVDRTVKQIEKYFGPGPDNIITQIDKKISIAVRKEVGIAVRKEVGIAVRKEVDIAVRKEVDKAFSRHNMGHGKSPITFTDFGEEIAEAIDASKIASRYVDQVSPKVSEMNAYDTQKYCFTFADNLLADLKENHPNDYETIAQVAFDKGVSIESILETIVGIALRDAVLKRHGKMPAQANKTKPTGAPKGDAPVI